MSKIDVIYLMAGTGKRAELGYPKQFYRLGGKPIFIHALEKLVEIKSVLTIFIVCQTSMINEIQENLKKYGLEKNKVFHLIEGGQTRQESVYNALQYIITDNVLIAEGVRPFVTKELIIHTITTSGNVVPIDKSYASVYTNKDILLDRNSTGTVQLPQKFDTYKLKEAHKLANKELRFYNDDSDLLKDILNPVIKVFYGPQENIKVTTPFDLVIAEAIYKNLFGGNDE